MSVDVGSVSVEFKADTQDFDSNVEEAGKKIEETGKKTEKVHSLGKEWRMVTLPGLNMSVQKLSSTLTVFAANPMILALTAVGALSAGVTALVAEFGKWDEITSDFVKAGYWGDALGEANKALKDIMWSSSYTRDNIAGILSLLSKYDLPADALEDVATAFLDLQKVSGEDLASTVAPVMDALSAWEIPAENAATYLDRFYAIAQASHIPVSELTKDITALHDVLGPFGATVDGTAEFVAKLNRAGLDTPAIAQGLKSALDQVSPGRSQEQALAYLDRMIQDIREAPDAIAKMQAAQLFGADNGDKWAKAIKSGAVSVDALRESLTADDGKLADMVMQLATGGDALAKATNQILVALEPISNTVGPTIDDLTKDLGNYISNYGVPLIQNVVVPLLDVTLIPTLKLLVWTMEVVIATSARLTDSLTESGRVVGQWWDSASKPIGDWFGGVVEGASSWNAAISQGAGNWLAGVTGGSSTTTTTNNGDNYYNINIQSSGNASEDMARAQELAAAAAKLAAR